VVRAPNRRLGIVLAAVILAAGAWFAVAPTRAASNGFQFSAAGDFGSWTGFSTSLDLLNQSGSDFALALGDLSYGGNTGYANTTEEAWCLKFHKFFPDVAIVAGNHDTGAYPPGEGGINNYTKYCPYPFANNPPVGVYGKQYYFDYPRKDPLARFILISPDLVFVVDGGEHYSYDVGTPRYQWTRDAIESARADGIPWVIVAMHKNCIGAGEHLCETGPDILNLLLSEKVDLILNAHNHNYERSHQLALGTGTCDAIKLHVFNRDCIVHDGTDRRYQRGLGSVLVIAGTGGRALDVFNTEDPYAAYFPAWMGNNTPGNGNGIVTVEVTSDHIALRTDFVGGYSDSFTIGDFGLFTSFLQNLPVAAPVMVGLVGFGVGAFLVWRARKIGLKARDHKL
jgi:hypothetical protein